MPSPPKGFMPKAGGFKGLKATRQQVQDAASVARELKSPMYGADFPRAPNAAELGAALLQAQAWSAAAAAADAWMVYVHEMRDRAWNAAMARTKRLTPKFRDAVRDDAR
ncbi:MAG TPA: hypothetical protein VH560_01230 [Polyangia bacterium]|nr:hypothetical protein [Polyangia bacterium]